MKAESDVIEAAIEFAESIDEYEYWADWKLAGPELQRLMEAIATLRRERVKPDLLGD